MRSRALPTRLLTRIVTGGQQQTSSTSVAAAQGGSGGSSSSTSDARTSSERRSGVATTSASSAVAGPTSNVRLARMAIGARRRQDGAGSSLGPSYTLRRRRSSLSSRSRSNASASSTAASARKGAKWESVNGASPNSWPLQVAGITPVQPPQTSLINVALQNFFAAQRPLLEHEVVQSISLSSSSANGAATEPSEDETIPDAETRSTLESISAALVQSLHASGKLSAEELDHATVVIASVGGDVSQSSHVRRVEGIDPVRFNQLLDRLSSAKGTEHVRREAESLAEESRQEKDVEVAVSNALERGEDPSVAEVLGTEADLVILGEPEGPDPSWSRGVATYMAQSTRAYEAPPAPTTAEDGKSPAASFKIIEEREEDPNLILSHAMVQATLPPALAWDQLVAKMDAASLSNGDASALAMSIVNLENLDADVTSVSLASDGDDVEVTLDSTRRKRKKKMRKHKYRKLRKLTRIERSRLKK